MEVLLFIVGAVIAGALLFGVAGIALSAIVTVYEFMRFIWPLTLGCVVGVPLSLQPDTKVLGNVIVAAGIIGNVFWFKFATRK